MSRNALPAAGTAPCKLLVAGLGMCTCIKTTLCALVTANAIAYTYYNTMYIYMYVCTLHTNIFHTSVSTTSCQRWSISNSIFVLRGTSTEERAARRRMRMV